MATKFEFYLGEEDTNRLYALKEDNSRNDLSGNEYAKELLESILHRLHPEQVMYDDETGDRIKQK